MHRGLFVCHREGHRIGTFRGVWVSVCKRAGLAGRLVHDLRTAARDYRRAGVSEGEIMDLCGWRTRAMFDRYNIIDEQDLAARRGEAVHLQRPTKRPTWRGPRARGRR